MGWLLINQLITSIHHDHMSALYVKTKHRYQFFHPLIPNTDYAISASLSIFTTKLLNMALIFQLTKVKFGCNFY